jgi:hypothetical protein
VKRILFVVTFAVLLGSLILFSVSDTTISVAHSSVPANEVAGTTDKASNCSGSATITITMTGILNG